MKTEHELSAGFTIGVVLVVLGVLAGGVWFYLTEEHRLREDAEANLQAIAELKVDQIVAWRAERLADAAVLMESPFFLKGAVEWMTDPGAQGEEDILTRFRSLRDHYHYGDVLLTDVSGQVRLSLVGHPGLLHADAMCVLATAFREWKPVLADLHNGGTESAAHLDLVVPLRAGNGATSQPAGAVVLQIDPQQFLYPLIQSWPIPSRSAETLLVRREGDAVLFLNDLRQQQDTALKLRIPLSRTDVPAVMAVLGQEGITQGKDYRGVEVLSVLKPIPDSAWFLVAKVDVAEALSVQRFIAALILALILAIIVVAAIGVSIIWQRNQKAHYRSLSQAEARLRQTLDAAQAVAWELDLRTDVLVETGPVTALFGPTDSPRYTNNAAFLERIHPEDRERVLAAIQPGANAEDAYMVEFRVPLPDGSIHWIQGTGRFDHDAEGQPIRLRGIACNITERKQAEDQIRNHGQIQAALNGLLRLSLEDLTIGETLQQALVHMLSLPWFALSTGAIFLVDGPKEALVMAAQCGLSASALTTCARVPFGRCHCGRAALSHEIEFVSCIESGHENVLAGMSPHGHFCVPIRSAGQTLGVINLYVKEEHTRSQTQDDFLGAAAAILAGIIERKDAEQRRADLLEQLAETNQELKDFAYVVSHDLKAPLRAIRTLADWLATDYQDKLDASGRENLQLLGSRVDRMQGLIDGVLQYSRVGRTEQGTAPVDLDRLVPEIVENLSAPAHITIEVEPGLPTVEADPTRITQVFQNLLSNAIKYLDKPQGHIAVACVEEGGFWKFRVTDNGPGIEPKHFERIFKLFQTLAPRDDQESTGVGLTIAKKIVEMYGGTIWVESEVGQGSTFFFTFPVKKDDASAGVPGRRRTRGGGREVVEKAMSRK